MRIVKQKGNTTPGLKAVFYLTKSVAERGMKTALVKKKIFIHAKKNFKAANLTISNIRWVPFKPHVSVELPNNEKALYVIYQKAN